MWKIDNGVIIKYMSNGGSLSNGGSVFNLATEQGITQLLLSIRASELSASQKNELRDLVFLYTNGGHDESVKITLEQKISTLNVAPITLTTSAGSAPTHQPLTHPFGTSRPLPTFTPATTQTPIPATQSTPTTPTVAPTPQPATPIQQEAIVQPAAATPPVTQVAIPTPVVESTVTPSNLDPEQNLNRIREIKSIVNSQVGNPVNLIDINNDVGREYMAALLDAMKKLSGGASATSAMSRLEVAFKAVQETLKEHNDSKNQIGANTLSEQPVQNAVSVKAVDTKIPSRTPTDLPIDSIDEVQRPAKINLVKSEVTQPVTQPEPIPTRPRFETKSVPQPERAHTPEQNHPLSGFEQVQDEQKFDSVAIPETQPVNDSEHYQEPVAVFESAWGPATDTIKPEASATQQKVTSLANVKEKLRKPTDLADPASVDTSSVSGDTLYTKEVDEGLEQLLSEWQIFRKSGLFGTGPKGRAHPLFIKVASLQIPLLLAGRFEGATQEIKQSITDYMNGWRYEQGIIYEQGENFEHYLRRVIRHILDLQNR